ncbi:hypothetical protein TcCL_ESM07330 [Trypanosoma cruzi]|nr:hypothetical protein TcCL_ESM07330 [Trypanosoma cruzi]
MVGDAQMHRTSGSRDSPTGIWTDGMEQTECVAAAACPELKCSANGRTAIMPSAVASPCCQRSVRNSLVPSRSQACDTLRHGSTTSPLLGSAVLRCYWDCVCALPRQHANRSSVTLSESHLLRSPLRSAHFVLACSLVAEI